MHASSPQSCSDGSRYNGLFRQYPMRLRERMSDRSHPRRGALALLISGQNLSAYLVPSNMRLNSIPPSKWIEAQVRSPTEIGRFPCRQHRFRRCLLGPRRLMKCLGTFRFFCSLWGPRVAQYFSTYHSNSHVNYTVY